MTSNLVPFASHPANTLALVGRVRRAVQRARPAAPAPGKARVSTHPGQYTVLSSKHRAVAAAAVAELGYHATLLAALGLDRSHKIVLHVGSGAADRRAARGASSPRANGSRTARASGSCSRTTSAGRSRRYSSSPRRSASPWSSTSSTTGSRPRSMASASVSSCSRRGNVAPEDGRQEVHFSTQEAGKRPGAHARDARSRRVRDLRRRGRRSAARLYPRGQGQGAIRPPRARAPPCSRLTGRAGCSRSRVGR